MSLAEKLATERRGRLAAERLLELKQAELYAANRKLGLHARALSEQIVETRAEVESVRDENERVKSDLTVAHQKVEIAERRLWHSIETIQDGFAFFDNDDHLIAANASYLAVFDGLEEIQPGVAYARVLQLLTEEGIVNTEERNGAEWRSFMMRRRQQDKPEPVIIRLWNDQYVKMVDHRNPGGDLVSLGLNITATVRYERELKEARAKAEAAARAKSAFLANMSHEIRTPMNGVVGMAELLADSELNDEQSLYVDTIRNSGEALLVIINDILDFSKIEAEKMLLHKAPFDLEKSVHEVQMLVQPAAREKNLSLLLDYDMFLPSNYVGDIGRIRQILTNLIGNAVKFTTEGHVLVRITGSPSPESDTAFLHFAIEDTGIGIAPEQLDSIFGEFTQVEGERNRKFEGTGLGLAISKRLVELMGGEIWADSEVGVGSCFGFKIPLQLDQDTDQLAPAPLDNLKKALVVDDNTINRDILRRQLEFLGVAAEGYATSTQALKFIPEGFDLLMIEHNMPDIQCANFVQSVRELDPNIAIIILTSNPGGLIEHEVSTQVSAILPRPLPRAKLIAALNELGANMGQTGPEASTVTVEAPQEPIVFRRSVTSDTSPKPVETPISPVHPDASEPLEDPTISLHPEQIAQPAAPQPPSSDVQDPPKVTPRKMRVLAAEDNKTNQLVLRKMVKDLEIDLQIANNGIEAVEAYSTFAPDMIFMDISMPEMDGKEATQKIREQEATTGAHIPIVALTAHAQDGDEKPILAAGLDHYLTKPLRKPAIHDMVRQLTPENVLSPFVNLEAEMRQAG